MIFITALWLGILTSISPCPLASNIVAISFLSKKIMRPRLVLWTGIFYTLGRMVSYAVLGIVIIMSLVSVPTMANFLQKYMNKALGPILLIIGLFLLDIIKFNLPSFSFSQEKQKNLASAGIKGSFALGAIFALSFCPISAALFFGSLIPLSLNKSYGLALPFIYGLGTALPMVIFAVGISCGAKAMGTWFNKLSQFEIYARRLTGVIFILVGVYYLFSYYR